MLNVPRPVPKKRVALVAVSSALCRIGWVRHLTMPNCPAPSRRILWGQPAQKVHHWIPILLLQPCDKVVRRLVLGLGYIEISMPFMFDPNAPLVVLPVTRVMGDVAVSNHLDHRPILAYNVVRTYVVGILVLEVVLRGQTCCIGRRILGGVNNHPTNCPRALRSCVVLRIGRFPRGPGIGCRLDDVDAAGPCASPCPATLLLACRRGTPSAMIVSEGDRPALLLRNTVVARRRRAIGPVSLTTAELLRVRRVWRYR
jgi:hypothetical protein